LAEHKRSTKVRPYRMSRRAEAVDETRLRIVEAAVDLHGTLGPAATTVAAIAEHAGVTRATVYRHFADDAAIFGACSAHWLAGQTPPDPAAWARVKGAEERLRAGLSDLYRFYRAGEEMLSRVYRDMEWLPEAHRAGLEARERAFRDVLLAGFPGARTKVLRAVVGHAVSFWTWHSLCVDHGLGNTAAVEAMTALALSASPTGRRR
jgi:AcrR family transcriptional regulator